MGLPIRKLASELPGSSRRVVDIFRELLIKGEIPARILSLEESMLAANEVTPGFEGMATVGPGEGILELVIVLFNDFRKPVLIADGAVAGNHNVRQTVGVRIPRDINSGNAHFGGKRLIFEKNGMAFTV